MPRRSHHSISLTRLFAAFVLWAVSVCCGPAAAQSLTATQLMDWAQTSYPDLFPSRQVDQLAAPYVYRYYPETSNYLGVDGESVYVMGPVSGGALLKVGVLSEFKCRVLPADCVPKMTRRLVATNYASMGLTSDGRLFVWGYDPTHLTLPRQVDLAENAAVRQLATGVTSAVAHDSGVAVLSSTGQVLGIGHNFGWMGGDIQHSSMKVTTFSPVLFSGKVLAIAAAWGRSTLFALYENGTVWQLPGEVTRLSSSWQRFTPKQVVGPSDVVSLSADGRYAVQRDGAVWSLIGRDSTRLTHVPPIKDLVCGGSECLAITTSGTAVAFDGGSFAPTTVRSLNLSNVTQVAGSGGTGAALTGDGQLWTWGRSGYAGQGTAGSITVPTPVAGFNNVTDIACASHCVVRRADGSVWGWGTNLYGALGTVVQGPGGVALGNPVLAPVQATGLVLN